ncbi:MAG TPA: VOC family protein [Vicinamibacteria bacterium]|nr:VOC family protein [Vicinamibacteria bacterium]
MTDLLQGRFVWSELMTPDTKAAERFYSKVVGWTTQPFDGSNGPYTLWMAGKQSVGGLMETPPHAKQMPPSWMVYVGVNDADATARHAHTLGGKVGIAPTDIPKVGRFAVLNDPQGAHISILQPSGPSPTGPETDPAPLEISWRELATTDVAAAMQFYRGLFGWEQLKANDMGPMGVYQEFGRFGRSLGGIYRKPPEMPGGPRWLMYAKVPDIQAAVATVKNEGGKVLNGPMEVPGGDLVAQIQDPQGADFALHQTKG